VGSALSQWEMADQALALLFGVFANCRDSTSHAAVSRAYGSIESNTGRRKAVEAAAEVYFSSWWDNKAVRQSVTDIINAVMWASRRRDDIAHGIAVGISIDHKNFGFFHMPPEYNTGRTHLGFGPEGDPLRTVRARYRYTAEDINLLEGKFRELWDELTKYWLEVTRRDDGNIKLIVRLMSEGKV